VSKKKDLPAQPPGPFHNPFASLAGKRDSLPEGPPPPADKPSTAQKKEPSGPARAVVRYERKGHGGKEVTLVEHLELPSSELDAWLKPLKQSLGCGGRVEGNALVLQGDQRDRLPALLTSRGVRKVTVS
jgi:translation initiation factor 1